MQDTTRWVRRVAVLGAGVMGAQIAAHFANARVPVDLFELPAEGDPNGNVKKAMAALAKAKPPALGDRLAATAIHPANYAEDLARLSECDLVIEAIAERPDWKHDLYAKIAPHLHPQAVLASNTSGIGIGRLAESLPESLRARFCGVHFFNPPRYMHLLELIPHGGTDPAVLDRLEGFLTTTAGKGVVRAKDTPSFIANRIGVFSMLAAMHHAERLELPFDLVDKLTGAGLSRPKSATFRTADVVGLDTLAHVVNTLAETLPDDPWHRWYRVPDWLQRLVEAGALGQKSGTGVYKKAGKAIHVLDLQSGDYRPVRSALDDEVRAMLNERDVRTKSEMLQGIDSAQGEFLRAIHRDLFQYCACHLEAIADSAREVDLALRWGYGWQLGPFETWQAAGWQAVTSQLHADIEAGRTMAAVPLPAWVADGREAVHTLAGSWSPARGEYLGRSTHPVYRRQVFPARLQGEPAPATDTVFETESVRCFHTGDEVAVLSFKTKMHTVDEGVLDGILQAVEAAERDFKGLVLWQAEGPFSAGANLFMVLQGARAGEFDRLEAVVRKFQRATQALRYARVPTVVATEGLTLGGGCEMLLHADRAVCGMESYVGLVEAGVGLIPGAGGSKEMALRAADAAKGGDLFPFLARYFEQIAMAKVAAGALEAREFDYLRPSDVVVFNPYERLHVAKQQALALYQSGYRPPLPREQIPVAGAPGMATLEARVVNLRDGGFISEHDARIASGLARVMCGGPVDPGSLASEAWLLELEIQVFMELLRTEPTLQRIQHMLETGKPLRN